MPPQSSQKRKIADEFQNLLSPIASTTLATHAGPCAFLMPGWSEVSKVGVIQVTFASFPFATSLRKRDGGLTTSAFQSGPSAIFSSAWYDDQMPPSPVIAPA